MMGELARLDRRTEYRLLDDLDGIRAALRRLEADRSEVARPEPWLSKKDLSDTCCPATRRRLLACSTPTWTELSRLLSRAPRKPADRAE